MVKIIKSPYSNIKKGTIVKLLQIIYHHFGPREHLYIVDLDNGYFRKHEVEQYAIL